MQIIKPAISDQTRASLMKEVGKIFVKTQEGVGLDAVVSEVLSDKDLFIFLAAFLPTSCGLKLGELHYYSQSSARITLKYGVTVDFETVPRKTKLFAQDAYRDGFPVSEKAYFFDRFLELQGSNNFFDFVPSGEQFAETLNYILRNPSPYVMELNFR